MFDISAWDWMGVTEEEFNQIIRDPLRVSKCIIKNCENKHGKGDYLCAEHRKEFEDWQREKLEKITESKLQELTNIRKPQTISDKEIWKTATLKAREEYLELEQKVNAYRKWLQSLIDNLEDREIEDIITKFDEVFQLHQTEKEGSK